MLTQVVEGRGLYGLAVFRFTSPLWEHEGAGSWHFVSLPAAIADEIDALVAGQPKAGFGSVRVEVTVGVTTWATSVFPDAKRATYVLPIKKEVRRAEGLVAGGPVDVALDLAQVSPRNPPFGR